MTARDLMQDLLHKLDGPQQWQNWHITACLLAQSLLRTLTAVNTVHCVDGAHQGLTCCCVACAFLMTTLCAALEYIAVQLTAVNACNRLATSLLSSLEKFESVQHYMFGKHCRSIAC